MRTAQGLLVFAFCFLQVAIAQQENPAALTLKELGVTLDFSALKPMDRPVGSTVETIGEKKVDRIWFATADMLTTWIFVWRVKGAPCAGWASVHKAWVKPPVKPFPVGWQSPLVEHELVDLSSDVKGDMESCLDTDEGDAVVVHFPKVIYSSAQGEANAAQHFMVALAAQLASKAIVSAQQCGGCTKLEVVGANVKLPAGWDYSVESMNNQRIDQLVRKDNPAVKIWLNRYGGMSCSDWLRMMAPTPLKPGKVDGLVPADWNPTLLTRETKTVAEVDACREVAGAVVLATVAVTGKLAQVDRPAVRKLLESVGGAAK